MKTPQLIYKKLFSPTLHYLAWVFGFSNSGCRFLPTCSEYSKQAFHKHGIIQGGKLTLIRLIRCQPFSKGGYDPVPDKIK